MMSSGFTTAGAMLPREEIAVGLSGWRTLT